MKKSVPRQIFRDRKKHAMKNNFTDSWIHAIIVSEETFGEEKYRKKKKKGEEMQRREAKVVEFLRLLEGGGCNSWW